VEKMQIVRKITKKAKKKHDHQYNNDNESAPNHTKDFNQMIQRSKFSNSENRSRMSNPMLQPSELNIVGPEKEILLFP
jgi:hypothetical protein